MMKDGTSMTDQDDMTESTPSPSLAGSDISVPQIRTHTAPSPKQHIDLYYDHFHVAHLEKHWIITGERIKMTCSFSWQQFVILVLSIQSLGVMRSYGSKPTICRASLFP
jgi:hypothetical protein